MKIDTKEFQNRLDKALYHYFDTLNLMDDLLNKKTNIQEIILLACSRLDSLANLLKNNHSGQKNSFIQFLFKFSGEKKLFNRISVGDLYEYLMYNGNLADAGLVEKVGRLRRFGPQNDDFLLFIEKSTIPITSKSVRQISFRITDILEKNYRVKLGQFLSKEYISTSSDLKHTIVKEFKNPAPQNIEIAIEHLLEKFKIGTIFYEKYRCDVIHGLKITVDEEKFFKRSKPFHGAYDFPYGVIYNIVFPGQYLRNLLYQSVKTLHSYFKARKKVPLGLFDEIFDFEEMVYDNAFDYLDFDSLEEPQNVKWQINRSGK